MSKSVPNQPIFENFFTDYEVELFLKREDLLHPYISGNKFRKLKYNLTEAQSQKSQNRTLAFAKENGMRLHFIDRSSYKLKNDFDFIEKLKKKFGDFYLLPEGGTNHLAIKGCEEILTPEDSKFTHICCAVGTGGTLSGLINSSEKHQQIIGFPVLKENYLHQEISKKTSNSNWRSHIYRKATFRDI